ncbi:MAG: hypothetical protein AAGF56_11285 [Pseudomonadota bacterium]
MRILLIIAGLALLPGCFGNQTDVASLDMNFAKTSLGFRNTGNLSSGTLYLWDQAEGQNSLVRIASDIPLVERQPNPPGNRVATSVTGFAIQTSAQLTDAAIGEIQSEVINSVSFSSTNAITLENPQPERAMSATYAAQRREHEANPGETSNPFVSWRVADATQQPDRYKYVLLNNAVLASAESLSYNNEAGTTFDFDVPTGDGVNLNVRFNDSSSQSCTETVAGQRATCYISAKVYRVFLNEANNLDYAPVAASNNALADAFRRLN